MKKRRYFKACAALQFRRAAKQLAALLLAALVALLLAGAGAAAVRQLAAGRGFVGVTLAVAAEDGDARIDTMLGLVGGADSLTGFATVITVPAQDAEALLRSGGANAVVLLPAGFVDSVMTGENLSPKLMVDTSRPLEAMLVSTLAESAIHMLTRAQQGIGLTLELYDDAGLASPARSAVITGINLAYGTWVLGQDGMVRTTTAGAAGALSVSRHYLLAALLFFAAMSLPLLYRLYALSGQRGWLGRLRGAGCPLWAYAAAQIAAGALTLLAMLCLLAGGVWLAGGRPAPGLGAVPGLVLAAVALSCFGFLCCNTGSLLAAVSLDFVLTLAALITFGGLVPLVLLPAPVAALAPFSPLGWLHRALAPLLGAPVDAAALGLSALLCAGLFGLCLLVARHRERRAAA